MGFQQCFDAGDQSLKFFFVIFLNGPAQLVDLPVGIQLFDLFMGYDLRIEDGRIRDSFFQGDVYKRQ